MTAFFGTRNGKSLGGKVTLVWQGIFGLPQIDACVVDCRRWPVALITKLPKTPPAKRAQVPATPNNFRSPHDKRTSDCETPADLLSLTYDLFADGGEGGIRTHGTGPRSQHFQCCQFNHSCTSPGRISNCEFRVPERQARSAN